VIGIVAARIREAAGRPAFVVALDGGKGKGSGRSMTGVDLGAGVTAALQAGLLINGGGHPMAAGLTVAEEVLPALRAFLNERLGPSVRAAAEAGSLGIDGAVALAGANTKLLDALERASPYGAGNPEPRFVLPACQVVRADIAGEKHVRCILADGLGQGRLKAVAFRSLGDNPLGGSLLAANGRAFHLAGHLRADNWRGERRIQFVIEDAALASA
jgi:single-stranded-DNA-specific exonuclease